MYVPVPHDCPSALIASSGGSLRRDSGTSSRMRQSTPTRLWLLSSITTSTVLLNEGGPDHDLCTISCSALGNLQKSMAQARRAKRSHAASTSKKRGCQNAGTTHKTPTASINTKRWPKPNASRLVRRAGALTEGGLKCAWGIYFGTSTEPTTSLRT